MEIKHISISLFVILLLIIFITQIVVGVKSEIMKNNECWKQIYNTNDQNPHLLTGKIAYKVIDGTPVTILYIKLRNNEPCLFGVNVRSSYSDSIIQLIHKEIYFKNEQ